MNQVVRNCLIAIFMFAFVLIAKAEPRRVVNRAGASRDCGAGWLLEIQEEERAGDRDHRKRRNPYPDCRCETFAHLHRETPRITELCRA